MEVGRVGCFGRPSYGSDDRHRELETTARGSNGRSDGCPRAWKVIPLSATGANRGRSKRDGLPASAWSSLNRRASRNLEGFQAFVVLMESIDGTKDQHTGHTMPMEKKADEHASHIVPMEKKAQEPASHTMPTESKKEADQMQSVFNNYFEVKDALVSTNASAAAAKGANLVSSLKAIKMNELPMDVHMVWMKVMKELESDAQKIANSKKIEDQRKALILVTKNIYALMKVAKTETPTYYQFCPMANGGKGANWLSKENEVKNPYYGSMMMSCGSTVETIN